MKHVCTKGSISLPWQGFQTPSQTWVIFHRLPESGHGHADVHRVGLQALPQRLNVPA